MRFIVAGAITVYGKFRRAAHQGLDRNAPRDRQQCTAAIAVGPFSAVRQEAEYTADWHPQRAVLANTALRFSASSWMLPSLFLGCRILPAPWDRCGGLKRTDRCTSASRMSGQIPNRLICSFSYPCSRAHKSKGIVASSSTTATASPVFVKSMLFR